MRSRHHLVVLLASTLAVATLLSGQEPAPKTGIRLLYDLPAEALVQVTKDSAVTAEQVLDETLVIVRKRVPDATVSKLGSAGFAIELPAMEPAALAATRARIESLGKLEMRIVAEGSFNMDGVKFDLAAERKRLEEWLQGGGKDLLLMNPRNIEQFHSRAPAQGGPLAGAANLQWFVRRIEPSLKNPKFWSTSYAQGSSELAQATVTVFDHNSPDEWNGGQVPAALLRGKARPCLLELVAINMKERHFQGSDLVSAHAAISPDGSPSIGYKMRDDRCADYANWSQQYIKHHAAILLEDTIRSAPVFQSRIPGSGEIHGDFTKAEVDEQVRVLNAGCLRVTPHYVGQEPAGKNAHR